MKYNKLNRFRYILYRISIIIWNIRYFNSIIPYQKPSSYFMWKMSISIDRLNISWLKIQNLINEINEQEDKNLHICR
jgi:hypothetical protein